MNAKWKPYLQRQKVSLKVWRLRRTRVYFFFDMCKIKCIPGLLHRLPRADQDRMRRLTAPSPAYPQGLREGQGRATQQPILKEPVPWGPQDQHIPSDFALALTSGLLLCLPHSVR